MKIVNIWICSLKLKINMERWPSGLRRTLGKRVEKLYHGFESHSLRQVILIDTEHYLR